MVGFSEVKLSHKAYESAAFNACGHKWRLIFHPAGKEGEDGGKDHVSIYARIENVAASEMLMNNWEIKAELKFFIYNHNVKKYSVFQDGSVKHYNKSSNECGLAQMLPLSKFNDPCNGYIDEDACTIGVEIFVLKPIEKVERVVITHNPPNNKFTWKISGFSKLGDKKYHYSDEFVIGQRHWKMSMNPKGDKGKNGLSVYVDASAFLPNTVVSSIYAKFKLRVLNQKNTNHVEKTFWQFYSRESGDSYGKAELISLEELKDESKGYLVKDSIVLETVMLCVSETKLVDSTI
ncbi:hypothetical protein Bca52824_002104 [Brassica carinata]|uniref:MATH domain-containing protein n=1 Tax=Brassica carinata TaxID=52824 RepID=A0A8X8BA99_BRACI|nr:hypothetical protein Bca52824_002104 [Brassica carinata]